MKEALNRIYNMDCLEGMERLYKKYGECVDLIITSPPYAEQRKHQYGGVSEKDYPIWTVQWMQKAKQLLKPHGSVFINIRPHLSKGVISDYVLKTRLALRQDGWKECEELIWIKPDSPPLGSIKRPRRAWESILWFSKTHDPFCDPKANGTLSNRIGFENKKFEHGGVSHIHAGQNGAKVGVARCKDYVEVGTGKIEKDIKHPAVFPKQVPEYLIKMCSLENSVICDLFMGSGTTAIACMNTNRNFIGFELDKQYYELANQRIAEHGGGQRL
jgi:site-specific DNA-methyltransferase (adenine-specific)